MTKIYEADGEKWEVYLSSTRPHAGVRAVVFTCVTNSSHGWRVVEVPAARFPSRDRIEEIDDDELEALYARSEPFDYSHDPKARQDSIGRTPERLPHEGP